jgi:serine protease Do
MRIRALFGLVVASGLGLGSKASAAVPLPTAIATPICSAPYADDFSALSAAARDFDHRPEATFSYCTRNAAVYECLSYGSDGGMRRDRRKVTLHGTAFAYRKQSGDTLLLTNDHVGAWPAVTDAQHSVDGVPIGCKRVSETLTLVDDEHDAYGKDDIRSEPRHRGVEGARGAPGDALEDRTQRGDPRAEPGGGARVSLGSLPRDQHRQGGLGP